ncbi:hypothetical protein GOBAR_AA20037 [Gossypium barbadense]|uniref:Zinc finger LSD1-type domain-containing protein n=1 Tax=Gossypium barbadense TaxID=3634 RepID=A0A2P5XBB3_GOSBA|nr:hypothetical protein GOBAR_AA20037 [Gossypium barbadense]
MLTSQGPVDMQSQIVCSGCRSNLLYPRGATNVCCALCNTITQVPLPGMDMGQLICGGCRTLLMYARGGTSVRCSCCHTLNLAPGLPIPHSIFLIFQTGNARAPFCFNRPNQIASAGTMPSTSTSQTVVVENPMSVDESGKLVSNVVVGITTDKK